MGKRGQDGFQAALSCEHRQPEKPSCPTILPVIFILPAHGLQASRRGRGASVFRLPRLHPRFRLPLAENNRRVGGCGFATHHHTSMAKRCVAKSHPTTFQAAYAVNIGSLKPYPTNKKPFGATPNGFSACLPPSIQKHAPMLLVFR